MAGPERALVPFSGPTRRRVLKISAIALGTMEKTMWSLYEAPLSSRGKGLRAMD